MQVVKDKDTQKIKFLQMEQNDSTQQVMYGLVMAVNQLLGEGEGGISDTLVKSLKDQAVKATDAIKGIDEKVKSLSASTNNRLLELEKKKK